MNVVISCVADMAERTYRCYAYSEEDGENDRLMDARHADEIVNRLCDGDILRKGMPPPECEVVFDIYIGVTDTHRNVSHYRANYKRYEHCPVVVSTWMMGIYSEVKRVLRESRNEYKEKKEKKGE